MSFGNKKIEKKTTVLRHGNCISEKNRERQYSVWKTHAHIVLCWLGSVNTSTTSNMLAMRSSHWEHAYRLNVLDHHRHRRTFEFRCIFRVVVVFTKFIICHDKQAISCLHLIMCDTKRLWMLSTSVHRKQNINKIYIYIEPFEKRNKAKAYKNNNNTNNAAFAMRSGLSAQLHNNG